MCVAFSNIGDGAILYIHKNSFLPFIGMLHKCVLNVSGKLELMPSSLFFIIITLLVVLSLSALNAN